MDDGYEATGQDDLLRNATLVAACANLWLDRYGQDARASRDLVASIDELLGHAAAAAAHGPKVLDDYVGWAKTRHPDTQVLRQLLACLADTLAGAEVPGQARLVAQTLSRFDSIAEALPPPLPEDEPMGGLCRHYTDFLLAGDRAAAERIVMDAVEAGATLRDLYLLVFQPALYDIGRRWQANSIGVADEHYFTAATQAIMARLQPRVFATPKTGPRLLAACAPGERHDVGIRMVADIFELEGWRTEYLGADMPLAEMVERAVQGEYKVVAISATLADRLPAVAQMIGQLRDAPGGAGRRIMVGGRPFASAPELWRQLGADATAPDAEAALQTALRLVAC